jgi:hypothetical protein
MTKERMKYKGNLRCIDLTEFGIKGSCSHHRTIFSTNYRNLESQHDSAQCAHSTHLTEYLEAPKIHPKDNIHIIHMPIQTEHHPHSNRINHYTHILSKTLK